MSNPPEDPIGQLAQALYLYLTEVDHCRTLCLRHQADVGVYASDELFRSRRLFHDSKETWNAIRGRILSLPQWSKRNQSEKWLEEKAKQEHPDLAHIAEWVDRPVMLRVWRDESRRILIVEVAIQTFGVAEQVPPYLISMVLECHEHLMPESRARAVEGWQKKPWSQPSNQQPR